MFIQVCLRIICGVGGALFLVDDVDQVLPIRLFHQGRRAQAHHRDGITHGRPVGQKDEGRLWLKRAGGLKGAGRVKL